MQKNILIQSDMDPNEVVFGIHSNPPVMANVKKIYKSKSDQSSTDNDKSSSERSGSSQSH